MFLKKKIATSYKYKNFLCYKLDINKASIVLIKDLKDRKFKFINFIFKNKNPKKVMDINEVSKIEREEINKN